MWKLLFSLYRNVLLLGSLLCSAQIGFANALDLALPKQDGNYGSLQAAPLTLAEALSRAQSENPGIFEILEHAEAMAAIPLQMGSLADPVISFNTLNLPVDTLNVDQEAMTQLQFGIKQQIPYPGKLALRESIASHMANAANSNVDVMRLQLDRDVKTLWWRLFFLDRSVEVVEINQTLLRQFIEIAQTKYKVGQGLQQDVLLAQLELSKLIDRKIQLVSNRKQEAARLNALLNRPADTPIQLPPLTAIDTALPNLIAANSILQKAKDNHPSLAEKKELIQAATDRHKLAERNLFPDFNVGASYGFRQGNNPDGNRRSDFFSIGVGVTVPLYADRKQKMAIAQRGSEVKEQQYALHNRWLGIQADITATIADYDRTREQVSLFKTGVIPQAHQTVSSMLAGYQVNKVDFLNLIRSQITLYNYETSLWQTISQGQSALAKLIATVGEENIYE